MPGEFCTLPGALRFGTGNQETGTGCTLCWSSLRDARPPVHGVEVPGQFLLVAVPSGKGTVDRPAPIRPHLGAGCRCPDLRTVLWGLIPHPLCDPG